MRGQTTEQGEWKPVIHDAISDSLVVPNGTMGQRWEEGRSGACETRNRRWF
ncbi:hypothetical protein ACVNPZ_05085 [Staphylococcus aureus]